MVKRPGVATRGISGHPVLLKEVLEAYPTAKISELPRVMTEDELIDFLRDCDSAITGLEPITEKVLRALPNLKVIGKFGVGCDTVDFEAVIRHQVRFGHFPGTNKLSVAELAICFMIAALRHVTPLNQSMRDGKRPGIVPGRQLSGRVVGIHGCGNVGKEVARLLQPFHCTLLACDIVDYADFYRQHGVTPVSFEELLARSEVLTIHLPLDARTRHVYDDAALAKLRPDAVLINTCRGGIVEEEALQRRLESGKLVAACSDVFAIEPANNDKLLRLPNFLATPHIGASADEARLAMGRAAIRGLVENELVTPGRTY